MNKDSQACMRDKSKDLYGIENDISLQSVNFAAAENHYLNERSKNVSHNERD